MHLSLSKVKVSAKDRDRYVKMMSNWDALHAQLSSAVDAGSVDETEVLRMLKVEVNTKKRLHICTRLLAVYHRLLKAENERRLNAALAR